MLFYASEKYPLEDSYSKYISEHGGSTNAFTSSEHTNYYFDVNPDSFEEALDRFAQFFVKPLMSADATTREIKAVDSENQKNLLSDAWRMNQLQKHLSVKDHPYHKFSTEHMLFYASDHLQRLKSMDPINVDTVLMLMKNLTVNLTSPEFEEHVSFFSWGYSSYCCMDIL